MRENKLRDLIRKGEPTLGTRVNIIWPGLTEIIGHTGVYDYVEFVSEYTPYDLYDLDNWERAAELYGLSTMIKLDQQPRVYLVGRALTAGIQNFLFADIRKVEDAEEAVKAVRIEPKGLSGIRMDRRVKYVGYKDAGKDLVKMCDDAVVGLMIEKKPAVDNLEEILSVEGVDMVQFGPGDYSLSAGLAGELRMGLPGFKYTKLREVELKIIKTALKMDVAPRAEIRTPEEAKEYWDLGVRHFSLENDLSILFNWWKDKGSALKQIFKECGK